jgi:hypothetical protein
MISTIFIITTYSNTATLLSTNEYPHSTSDLTSLTDLLVRDMTHIKAIYIQELYLAIGQSVRLTQHLQEISSYRATAREVNYDFLRQQPK